MGMLRSVGVKGTDVKHAVEVKGMERRVAMGMTGEIGAVAGNTKCYFCQGFGHFARECPKKGLGRGGGQKGDKGKGKGGKPNAAQKSDERQRQRR